MGEGDPGREDHPGVIATSFDLPSPGVLFASLLFGVVGFAAFMYGKKQARFSPMAIGAALMVYPYFVSAAWLVWSIGLVLCGALYWFRD